MSAYISGMVLQHWRRHSKYVQMGLMASAVEMESIVMGLVFMQLPLVIGNTALIILPPLAFVEEG